jgi:hypothetical protein
MAGIKRILLGCFIEKSQGTHQKNLKKTKTADKNHGSEKSKITFFFAIPIIIR